MDLTDSIAPKSDQLDAEDLLGGPRLVTIAAVREGPSKEQPVNIYLREFDRPWRPSKTVRRILVAAWGAEASEYTDRRLVIFRDPEVRFGGMAVGGIRVSHLSHIEQRFTVALAVTRGKRAAHVIEPLTDDASPDRRPSAPPTRGRRPEAETAPPVAVPASPDAGADASAPTAPASPPVEVVPDRTPISPGQRGFLMSHFKRLGIEDRSMRLAYSMAITGRDDLESSNQLTFSQASTLIKTMEGCRDLDALERLVNGQDTLT